MRRFFKWIGLVFVVLLSGCSSESWSWHQKLTVVVETPNGVVTGSSVTAVKMSNTDGALVFQEARGVGAKVTGEAVVVEVSAGKYLFVLLDGMNGLAWQVFDDDGKSNVQRMGPLLEKTRAVREVSFSMSPMMVTFGDINSPKSVRKVEPYDLAASFGAGYRLKSIALEITDEPVTNGQVEKVLGWWLTMRSGPYNSMSSLRLPNDSPRGWINLGALKFWSLDRLQEFDRKNK
ncbi:MAG: hypothetical protein JKX91_02375 [Rhizobiaceae bacterium]|nr:hypothetical protein [Rhizobiaceae bacterium]